MNDVIITLPSGESLALPYGTEVLGLLQKTPMSRGCGSTVAALVNNELVSLSYKLKHNAVLIPVSLEDPAGQTVYKRSLCFLLTIAARRLFPERKLVIGHALGDGYFYHFSGMEETPAGDIEKLAAEMAELAGNNLPITRTVVAYHEAVEYFRDHGQDAVVDLLEYRNESKIPLYRCGDYMDLAHNPLAPCTGILKHFQLRPYAPGFVLRFPVPAGGSGFGEFRDSPLLFSIYREYKHWGKVLNVSSVGRLNRISATREIREFIRVAEALQSKKIAHIADLIGKRREKVKIVLIAGPSSSGKTTFAKRLSIELTVLGFVPRMLSIDDYFVPREFTPRDPEGNYDFEALEAIDVELLNRHLLELFQHREIDLPVFDFKTGARKPNGGKLHLPPNGILLMEGIHGLNDRLTPLVESDKKYKRYVSALTQLNLDDHNRISTTDNRLIRRIVRDFQFRGHSAATTLAMWPSVRRGEDKNIFPFQDTADAAFNSALDYELGVLKTIAEPMLRTVKPDNPNYYEAVRLQSFIGNFLPIPVKFVPETSILREFVGDSGFKY